MTKASIYRDLDPEPLISVEHKSGGNIDTAGCAALFVLCAALYLTIYAAEGPVRYALYLAGHDNLILVRDLLIVAPMLVFAASGATRLALHKAFLVFGALMVFHGLVLFGTESSIPGAVYGAKVLMNVLFGFFLASLLLAPSSRLTKLFLVLWIATVIGVCLDKFVLQFPWVGMKTVVGDLNVDVSKDWQITDPMLRRVAGFERSSIAVASSLPIITIILLGRIRGQLPRMVLAFFALATVFLTTQKGAMIAAAPIFAILSLSPERRLRRLRLCLLVFVLLAVGLPLFSIGTHIDRGAGVFSTESLYLRVADTWPRAWEWITQHQMLWFGVGLGGIGGPQRLYDQAAFNPADNIALLLYAYFGVFAILYVGVICFLALRRVTGAIEPVEPAIAILAFVFGYGAVLSVIEDQAASLFLGAAIGALWRETRPEPMKEKSCEAMTYSTRPAWSASTRRPSTRPVRP